MGPKEIDESTDVIHLNIPIVYYQKEQSDIYVRGH